MCLFQWSVRKFLTELLPYHFVSLRENGYPITEEEKMEADAKMAEYDQKVLEMVKQSVTIGPKKN